MHKSHRQSQRVGQILVEMNESQSALQEARNSYMPVAETAASLFFLAKDLHRLERIYIFSLSWFMDLFKQELRWKPPIKEQEAQQNDESFDPVQDLQKRLVASVYRRICLSIFDEDKALISAMIAYQLAKKEIEDSEGSSPMKEIEIALWQFFMKGLN